MSFFSDQVDYSCLNARQKENFNFQKVSAVLADHGFMTLRVSSDWQSADFIAQHIDGVKFLKVQLKGSFAIDEKFTGKDLYMCFPDRPFPDRSIWYLCPHDMLVSEARKCTNICNTDSWKEKKGTYRAAKPPPSLIPFLDQFALA